MLNSLNTKLMVLSVVCFLVSCGVKAAPNNVLSQYSSVRVQETNASTAEVSGHVEVMLPRAGQAYVEVGEMSVNGVDVSKTVDLRAKMRKSVLMSLSSAQWISTESTGAERPSKSQLMSNVNPMFYVNATVTERSGLGDAFIKCGVSLIIATYPQKSILGFVNYRSEMNLLPKRGETMPSDIAILTARDDCVSELLEAVFVEKTIPSLKEKVNSQKQ